MEHPSFWGPNDSAHGRLQNFGLVPTPEVLTKIPSHLMGGKKLVPNTVLVKKRKNLQSPQDVDYGSSLIHFFFQEFRQQYFGWSFGLAWICIVLCYVSNSMQECETKTLFFKLQLPTNRLLCHQNDRDNVENTL